MTGLPASAVKIISTEEQSLSPELRRIARIFCEVYESIDLRIETTLGKAERVFIDALPELRGHEAEMRQLVQLLLSDVHKAPDARADSPLLLRFAYQDAGDFVEQLLSGASARLMLVPVEGDMFLRANIGGSQS